MFCFTQWVKILFYIDGYLVKTCRSKWKPTPVFLPGKSHGQRSLVGYILWGHKESDMTANTHTQVGSEGEKSRIKDRFLAR